MPQTSPQQALLRTLDQIGGAFRRQIQGYLEAYNLPRPIQDLVATDVWQHALAPIQHPNHVPFLDAYLNLRDHKTISVFGGSRLERTIAPHLAIFGLLNRALGRLLQEGGWSVISGGGPGKAMKGLQFCLKEAKITGQGRNCLAVSVASDLNDEELHQHSDIIVRSPENITDRERMIYALAKVGLYYPGHYGTNAEIAEGFLQNYLVNRGPYPYDPAPMILVSYDIGDGTHFWERLLKQFQEQSIKASLSKGEGHDWLKVVILPSHQEVGEMNWAERECVFATYAGEIMKTAEAWIAAKYQNTLTGGFEKEQFAPDYRNNWSR